jgi:hypothetical protein
MVKKKVASKEYEDEKDPLERIDDPYDLYDEEINEAPIEELDIKQIIKDEKKKIKTFSFDSIKYGSGGSFSIVRLFGYLFLVLGFIALKNNALLDLKIYLPSLALGIYEGYLVSKGIYHDKR